MSTKLILPRYTHLSSKAELSTHLFSYEQTLNSLRIILNLNGYTLLLLISKLICLLNNGSLFSI